MNQTNPSKEEYMQNPTNNPDKPVVKSRSFSLMKFLKSWYVWIFPLIAAGTCIYLVIDSIKNKGTPVTILLSHAEGLTPGKTPVKFRGVTVGILQGILIQEDNKSVLAVIELMKEYEKYAVKGSRFFIVFPQVGLTGVSGISALREGNYIGVEPGPKSNPPQFHFKSDKDPQMSMERLNVANFYLETPHLGSLNEGDPIFYRGFSIGYIVSTALHKNGTKAIIELGILYNYAKLIRANTVFWRAQAIHADIGFLAAEVKIGSLESLMKGGIEIATPDPAKERAKSGSLFSLLEEKPKEALKWSPNLSN